MSLRHAPFGIPEADLEQELERRRRSHRRALETRQAALAGLRTQAAELTQRIGQISSEISAVRQEEQELLQAMAPEAADNADAAPPHDPLAELRQTLAYYRSLQTEISAGVLALVAPFLKEGSAWTNTRRSG